MKKKIAILLAAALMATTFAAISFHASAIDEANLFPAGDMESANALTGWDRVNVWVDAGLSISTDVKHGGSQALMESGRGATYASAYYNIYDIFKANGAGNYTIELWVYADGLTEASTFDLLIRGGSADDENSFIISDGGSNYYARPIGSIAVTDQTWISVSAQVTVLESDITRESGNFNLCIDNLAYPCALYLDDISITKEAEVIPTIAPTVAPTQEPTAAPIATVKPTNGNIFSLGDMENANALEGWGKVNEWVDSGLSLSTSVKHNGSQSLMESGRTAAYASPYYNIYPIIKANGAGTYTIKLWVYADGLSEDALVELLIRGLGEDDANSFISVQDTNYFASLAIDVPVPDKTWTLLTGEVTVLESDIAGATGNFNLCVDKVPEGADLYFDDVMVIDPSKITDDSEEPHDTGDMMSLGYAVAALSSLGALAVSSKRKKA